MKLHKGVLKSFNPAEYTAVVRMSGSYKVYLEGIRVARNIPAGEMVAGRSAAVLFFDDSNATEAVVLGVYT